MSDLTLTEDIIDSRDIIARYEELNDEYQFLVDELEDANNAVDRMHENCETFNKENTEIFESLQDDLTDAQNALDEFNSSFDKDEMDTLKAIIDECSHSSEFEHGCGLIREDYFVQYITDLIHDCYEFPKEFESGKWPWNHTSIDYYAAAEEAKSDYNTVEINGTTYYFEG